MRPELTNRAYTFSLFLSAPLLIIGAYLKFCGLPYPNMVFLMGALLAAVYTYIGVWRVIATRSYVSKLVWVLAFFSINWIAGVVLYFTDFRSSKSIEQG